MGSYAYLRHLLTDQLAKGKVLRDGESGHWGVKPTTLYLGRFI